MMERGLRCCRNKEFLNYCCVVCMSVFHPSCLERYKEVVKLGGYRIFCSTKCQTTASEDEERQNDFQREILKLRTEINEKDNYIKRLNGRTRDFEDEVAAAEEEYNSKLNNQRGQITELNNELMAAKGRNEGLLQEVKNYLSRIAKLEGEIKEISALNNNMLRSIETLEKDNEVYFTELKALRQRLSASLLTNPDISHETSTRLDADTGVDLDVRGSTATGLPRPRRPQLLIVGDRNAAGSIPLLKHFTNGSYDINCQTFSRTLSDRIGVCLKLAERFTKRDYIVLHVGSQNAKEDKVVDANLFCSLLAGCAGSNLFIVGPPLWANRPILNRIIQYHDLVLQNHIRRWPNVSYLPSRSLTSRGLLSYSDRADLLRFICHLMSGSILCQSSGFKGSEGPSEKAIHVRDEVTVVSPSPFPEASPRA